MKIATLYDIHANLPALEAVLADVSAENVDAIVVGGDVVAGPMPSESLAMLQAADTPVHYIHGNAESETLRYLAGEPVNGLSPRAEAEAEWVASALTDEQKAFIHTWPTTVQLGNKLFCHATPRADTPVFTANSADERVRDVLFPLPPDINTVIVGHTHRQFERMIGSVRVVNSGSVGMPFADPGAFWLLIDGDVIQFRSSDYDRDAAAERIRESDYSNAEQFVINNVLSVPPREAVETLLAQLEART